MTASSFLTSTGTQTDIDRAISAGRMALHYLELPLDDSGRREAEMALTVLLDDPSPTVRIALADVLGPSEAAPLYVIRSLAADSDPVASRVLRSTQLLTDAEIVDLAAEGTAAVQHAIAERDHLSPQVAAALCEVADAAACSALLSNDGATVLKSSVQRLAERFADDAGLRELLLRRTDLAVAWRYELMMKLADKLENHPVVLERVPAHQRDTFLTDASDKIVLRLALEAGDDELPVFAEHLRSRAQLTTRLLLRAVCCGRLRFFAASLAVLGGVPLPRLTKVLAHVRTSALQAVLRKAGLPHRSHQAFLLAIAISRNAHADFTHDLPLVEARRLTEALLAEMQDEALGADEDVTAFLRRFAIDVVRLEARQAVRDGSQKMIAAA